MLFRSSWGSGSASANGGSRSVWPRCNGRAGCGAWVPHDRAPGGFSLLVQAAEPCPGCSRGLPVEPSSDGSVLNHSYHLLHAAPQLQGDILEDLTERADPYGFMHGESSQGDEFLADMVESDQWRSLPPPLQRSPKRHHASRGRASPAACGSCPKRLSSRWSCVISRALRASASARSRQS